MDVSCGWLAVRGRRIWLSIRLILHCRTTRRFWAVRTITWVAGKVAGVEIVARTDSVVALQTESVLAPIILVNRVARNKMLTTLDSERPYDIT